MDIKEFYSGKRVLVTGHTGFKGAWLCNMLLAAHAEVYGYALEPPSSSPTLFTLTGLADKMDSVTGDIRDVPSLERAFRQAQPEIVFHLAAQPLVREGYDDPVGTYSTNVMGTVHVLECIRHTPTVRSFLNVTTDKVYQNQEWVWAYREFEPLNGYDPYANSKSCAELVTECYRKAFFADQRTAISTARAGNVIGGGDFAKNRILPDCVRAALARQDILVRHPNSIRPYQHVLDALYAYLLISAEQYQNTAYAGAYNVGPDENDFLKTGDLVTLFAEKWGNGTRWTSRPDEGPHEDRFLKIDCAQMKWVFQWKPRWSIETAVEKTVEWFRTWADGRDINACMAAQMEEFLTQPLKEAGVGGSCDQDGIEAYDL